MPVRLTFEKNGCGDALILLHGLFGSGRNLDSISRYFSGSYMVYSPDLRNHGKSPHHEIMDYFSMADDINVFIEENTIKTPILVGHSMGGKVAMVNALQYPQMISALIVLDIAPVKYTFEYNNILEALTNLDLGTITSRREADVLLGEHYNNARFRQFLLQNLIRKDGRYSWRMNLGSIRKNINHITGFPGSFVTPFNGPCLFLGGENSEYISSEHQVEIDQLFPLNTVRMVAGAGHWLHAEQTERVNKEIQAFLEVNHLD